MTRHRLFALPLLMFLLSAVVLAARGTGAQGEQYDLVLMGGRVLDPETGLDARRNVGIRDGRIAAVTVEALAARETLAVAGLVVAPGFIDLHAHGQDSESYRYYAQDRKSTRLNSSHLVISYAVFCLKKKKKETRSHINYRHY